MILSRRKSSQSQSMTQREQDARALVKRLLNYRLPVFLALCLMLGGTSQDILAPKVILYWLSLALILWAVLIDGPRSRKFPIGYSRLLTVPIFLILTMMGLFALYIIPLSPSLWTSLPGREILMPGFEKLGLSPPALPLSLTPNATYNSIFDFLPPLAILICVALTRSSRELMLSLYTVIFIAVIAFPIGLAQAINPGQFKFYEIVNIGVPIGFFSNANHQAMFNVMAVPLAIYVASRGYRRLVKNDDGVAKIAMAAMALIMMLTTILMTESFAGFGLLIVVTILSLPMVFAKQLKRPKVLAGVVAGLAIFISAAIINAGDLQTLLTDKLNDSESISRAIIYDNTVEAIRAMGWVGSGPGSFYDIYLMYENRETMTTTFANQAHNDLLQVILELGIFGAVLMLAFVTWFIVSCFHAVKAPRRSRKLILILLVSILAVILHSLVDYPLRTIALASFTAFNVGYVSRLLRD